MFTNLKIRTKLMLGFFTVFMFVAIVFFYSMSSMSRFQEDYLEFDKQTLSKLITFPLFKDALNSAIIGSYEYISTGDLHASVLTESNLREAKENLAAFSATLNSADKRGIGREIVVTFDLLDTKLRNLMSLYAKGENEDAMLNRMEKVLNGEVTAMATFNRRVDQLINTEVDEKRFDTFSALSSTMISNLYLIILAIIVVFLMTYLLSGMILNPIAKARDVALQIAQGDFGKRIDISTQDEIGSLAFAFNKMTGTLERKVQENATNLGVARAKDEVLMESVGDGIVATDKNGVLIRMNRAAEVMLGWNGSEIVGKKWPDMLYVKNEKNEAVPAAVLSLQRALTTGKKIFDSGDQGTLYYTRKNGEKFPVAVTAAPVVFNGQTVGGIVVFRDISDHDDDGQAASEFVSLASHQLRSPLSAINWYIELMISGDVGHLNEVQKNYLREVHNSSKRMVKLVDGLLNVSRLELGTFVVDPIPTEITKLTDEVLVDLTADIKKHKVVVEKDYDPTLPIMNLDPNLMRIVMQNLISNAVKYSREQGQVGISIKSKGDNVLIAVSDNGFGIPEAQQGAIFTKLFRADNVREMQLEGTGLGLYMTKSIIENVEGKIWFESEENKGTTFYVTIPREGMKKKKKGTNKLS